MIGKNIKKISVLFITAIVSALIFCTIACQPTKAFASSPDLDPDIKVDKYNEFTISIDMTITSSKNQFFCPQEFTAATLKEAFKKYWTSKGHTSEFKKVMEDSTIPGHAIFCLHIDSYKWINTDSLCQNSLNEAVKDIFSEHPDWRKGQDFNIRSINFISAGGYDVNFNGNNCIHDLKTLGEVYIEHSDFHGHEDIIKDCPSLWTININNTSETYDINECNKLFKNVADRCNLNENIKLKKSVYLYYNVQTQKWQTTQP